MSALPAMPRIAILGANGQVGWELQRALQPLGHVIALSRADAPLDDLPKLHAALDVADAHVIVNAGAYTAVDKAESDPAAAQAVNATALASIGKRAARDHQLVIHYSTDYVFDGSGEHFRAEDAPTRPLSVYGSTKLGGEHALSQSGCAHLIFRTSWVYAARGGNFAKTMLRLAMERDVLNVVGDQWGAPTGADLIADTTAQCLSQVLRNPEITVFSELLPSGHGIHSLRCYQNSSSQLGTFHLVAAGQTNWHAYASHIIEAARALGAPIRVAADAVKSIPSANYPTPAERPLNSRLSTAKLQAAFDLHLPDWTVGVQRLVTQCVATN